jgi:hypothetical protein
MKFHEVDGVVECHKSMASPLFCENFLTLQSPGYVHTSSFSATAAKRYGSITALQMAGPDQYRSLLETRKQLR